MADTAFQTQFRQEFIRGFEQTKSLLHDSVTNEVMIKGNQATFLVADSGGVRASTRGTNGRIPGRPDNLTQNTITLREVHDKPQRTAFNIFASQGDGRRIMQETAMAVINREIDLDIIETLENATVTTGSAATASQTMVITALTKLGNADVPLDGRVCAVITPAFLGYLHTITEFASADYVKKKPAENNEAAWKDETGFYVWMGVKWIVHPNLPGAGTNAEKCFMYHETAVGSASPSELIQTAANYNEEDDYSYARCSAYIGSSILQTTGVIQMNHDGSAIS